MKHILAFESMDEYNRQAKHIAMLTNKLAHYKERLVNDFQLIELPKAIVWTSSENAMTVFSKKRVPAYTNKDTIFITPDVDEWKQFYLSQLAGEDVDDDEAVAYIQHYFQSITIDHVFCIVAHELTHHIELFPDEFDDERTDSIWFEEGMCEYLSQKLTLTPAQYHELRKVDQLMIALFKPKYGDFSLDFFGTSSYNDMSLAAIMLNYWRSAAAIHYLVEDCHDGNVMNVFALYNEWHATGRKQSLATFFGVEHF